MSKTDFSYCKLKLYPYGQYNQEIKNDMIVFLKELFGKLLYIDSSFDIQRIIQEWFRVYAHKELLSINMDGSFMSTMDIIIQTLYQVPTESTDTHQLVQEMYVKIPKSILYNDYIPVRNLLKILDSIKTA